VELALLACHWLSSVVLQPYSWARASIRTTSLLADGRSNPLGSIEKRGTAKGDRSRGPYPDLSIRLLHPPFMSPAGPPSPASHGAFEGAS
jgi:hypothetical protein